MTTMTIEFRRYKESDVSLLQVAVVEEADVSVKHLNYPFYSHKNGHLDEPMSRNEIEAAIQFAWEVQHKYRNLARIVIYLYGSIAEEANDLVEKYPMVEAGFDMRNNPEMDYLTEVDERRKQMRHDWRFALENGHIESPLSPLEQNKLRKQKEHGKKTREREERRMRRLAKRQRHQLFADNEASKLPE